MTKKVIILGGGVAGMSAAHELAERGFEVEIYELKGIPGGKARSLPVPDSQTADGRALPAEHGFRFFPGFYRHITDLMKRIPSAKSGESVLDQLVPVQRIGIAGFAHPPILVPANAPRNLTDLSVLIDGIRAVVQNVGLEDGELLYYAERLWQIVTSCAERRLGEYERIGWWEFIEADERSEAYKRYLANLTRLLVAADPRRVSTKTNGDILIQILLDIIRPWSSDRILNGPTNEVWIYPWLKYLLGKGVRYYINAEVTEFLATGEEVVGIRVAPNRDGGQITRVLGVNTYEVTESEKIERDHVVARGDYYIAAVPVEVMADLLSDRRDGEAPESPDQWSKIAQIDPSLKSIWKLRESMQWMNGVLFYFKDEVEELRGHIIHVDSPLALTSIFQDQYWPGVDLSNYGTGDIRSILSVDVSNWGDQDPNYGDPTLPNHGRGRIWDKPACQLERHEVEQEVWADVCESLGLDRKSLIEEKNSVISFLDPAIYPGRGKEVELKNKEPLLVNRVNTWTLRPEAHTRVKNLFLAADYVRTHTDLATMEAANEAARRAVNGILAHSNSWKRRCEIWPLREPLIFRLHQWQDRRRFRNGLPWKGRLPLGVQLLCDWASRAGDDKRETMMGDEFLTDDYWKHKRGEGDPPADSLVEELAKGHKPEDLFELLHPLVGLDRRRLDVLNISPQARNKLVDFLNRSEKLPDWADPLLIRDGGEFFREHAVMGFIVLACASLPACYSWKDEARVLGLTNRLQASIARRVPETAQLVVDVMRHRGLNADATSGGEGIQAALKVRLMHALMRYILEQPPPDGIQGEPAETQEGPGPCMLAYNWEDSEAKPLSQELLTATLLTFSYVIINGLRQMGVRVSEYEERAYMHRWNVLGHLVGIEEEILLNLTDAGDGKILFDKLMERNRGRTDDNDGAQLARSLLQFMENNLAGSLLKSLDQFNPLRHIPKLLTWKLAGEDTCSVLNIELALWERLVLVPFWMTVLGVGYLKTFEPFRDLSENIFGWAAGRIWGWQPAPTKGRHVAVPSELHDCMKVHA